MKESLVRTKLRSSQGETLAELLVSVLVVVLALTMFASALMASRKLLAQGDTILKTYYSGRNHLEAEEDKTEGTLIFEEERGTNTVGIGFSRKLNAATAGGTYQVSLYSEQEQSQSSGTQTETAKARYYRYSR